MSYPGETEKWLDKAQFTKVKGWLLLKLLHILKYGTLERTRPTHRRTDANLYPPERQLTKASEPSFDLEGGAKGQIWHQKIPSPQYPASWFHIANL